MRVLCLTKPTFRLGLPFVSESNEIASKLVLTHSGDYAEGWEFGLSDFMMIPSVVPTIYLGETFSVYLSTHNISTFDLTHVSIKAELQLQQAKAPRISLLDYPPSQIPSFPAGESQDFILKHEMDTEGVYILVLNVGYIKHDGEKKQLRKCFRFAVETPIMIRNKLHVLGDSLFVESQLTNTTKDAVFINTAALMLSSGQAVAPLPFLQAEESSWPGFYLKPTHCIQLLFQLVQPKLAGADVLGHLLIEWRTALGNSGKIRSEPLRPKPPPKMGIHMYFSDIPDQICLEEPFRVTCNVTNQSPVASVHLVLYLLHQKMTGVVISGISGQSLGKLSPLQSKSFPLTLFPLKPGVQKITGIRFVDVLCDKRYDFDNLLQIYVSSRTPIEQS